MAFTRKKQIHVYRKILVNLHSGDYISKARDGVEISKHGMERFINNLSNDGLIFLTTGDRGRTFVNFTNLGINVLRKSFGDDLFNVGKTL